MASCQFKNQYRNSFGWFGFGVDDEGSINTTENVGTSISENQDICEEDLLVDSNKVNDTEDKNEINNTVKELVDTVKTDVDKIRDVLLKNPKGLKSGKIASLIGLSKKEVNRILYSNKNMFTVDILFTWKLKQRD